MGHKSAEGKSDIVLTCQLKFMFSISIALLFNTWAVETITIWYRSHYGLSCSGLIQIGVSFVYWNVYSEDKVQIAFYSIKIA